MRLIPFLILVIPILLTLCGYLFTYFTYFYSKRQEQRKERLERINLQLNELYGPLLAIVQSNQKAWDSLIAKHDCIPNFYKKALNPPPEQVAEFHNWMRTVFIPNNEKLHEIIINNTSLLVEDVMPKVLLDLMAHIMEFRIQFEGRKDKQSPVAETINKYPGAQLLSYCEVRFRELKTEQVGIIKWRRNRN